MNTYVVWYNNGEEVERKPIVNLGWLLRHAHDVEKLYVYVDPKLEWPELHVEGVTNGREWGYVCRFADFSVLCEFVGSKRRVWSGLPISIIFDPIQGEIYSE